MLCGASDVEEMILPAFNSVCRDMEFQALNFINGDILYHNYGVDNWERNSKLTVSDADLLVFVINTRFGKITWNIEFEEAIINGKNFIVLCNRKTYLFYRQLVDNSISFESLDSNSNIADICNLIQRLEIEHQVTIISFDSEDFKITLKKQILILFKFGIRLIEKENKKSSFLPILLSSKFNDFPDRVINEQNDKMCKEILFDFFEKKEIRKKAMEYYFMSKTLNEEEIIELCLDAEQGISRKAIQNVNKLVTIRHNIDILFNEILPSIANEEVGVVRRCIKSFLDLSVEKSIEHFHLFFPANDVGTPRRIVSGLFDKKEGIESLVKTKPELKEKLANILKLALDYSGNKTLWRLQAEELLNRIKTSEEE